jgi:hypothetical protein
VELLLGHELGELGGFAELGEVGILHEEIPVAEAIVEGFAQIFEGEVLFACFGKELGDAEILTGALASLGGTGDDLG